MSLKNIDTIIFDLNGTLYERGIAIEGANDTLQKLREEGFHLSFITNTDGRSVQDVYQSIIKKGIKIGREELFTPFNMALTRTNSKPENTIVVGDDITTDILGAKDIHAVGVLVKTGVYNEEQLDQSDFKPDYIIDNINQLKKLMNI